MKNVYSKIEEYESEYKNDLNEFKNILGENFNIEKNDGVYSQRKFKALLERGIAQTLFPSYPTEQQSISNPIRISPIDLKNQNNKKGE